MNVLTLLLYKTLENNGILKEDMNKLRANKKESALKTYSSFQILAFLKPL